MSDRPGGPTGGPRRRRTDLLYGLVLAAACLLLRVPSLDRIALNPDESQYEATAAYLVATNGSAFALPYGTPGTSTLYKWMSQLFGSYPTYEVRWLVLLVCLATALGIYAIVSREARPAAGLLSGLVFLHYGLYFEGLSANREWFAGLGILLGVGLYLRSSGERGFGRVGLLVASGFASGCALWFKHQAAYIVLAVPVVLVWLAFRRRSMRELWEGLGAYVVGGVGATAVYLAAFASAGTLGVYLDTLVIDWSSYTKGNEAVATDGGPLLIAQHFFRELPARPLLLIGYLFALLVVAAVARRVVRPRSAELPVVERPAALVLTAWLVASIAAIQMGQHFFEHYYLFLVPPLAGLLGLALHLTLGSDSRSATARRVALIALALLVLERVLFLAGTSGSSLIRDARGIALAVYMLAGLGILAWLLTRPAARAGRALAAWIVLESALLVTHAQLAPTPSSLPHHRRGFDRLVAELELRGGPESRLFVWGWLPELYSLTRMEPASRFTICQYIVDDYAADPHAATLNESLAEMLMRDLESRPPDLIVDAAARSWTMVASGDPWLYELDRYPGFGLTALLESAYERVTTVDGCVVWQRRRAPVPGAPD